MRRETSHPGRELRSRPLQVQHPVSSKLVHPYCPRGAPILSMHSAGCPVRLTPRCFLRRTGAFPRT